MARNLFDQVRPIKLDLNALVDRFNLDAFDQHRRYAVIVLSDGGDDLEAFKFDNTTGWVQAAGVFWQVADALARAEDEARFEVSSEYTKLSLENQNQNIHNQLRYVQHRDLHQGQVLIAHIPTASSRGIVDYLSSASCGVQTTIIDFGLSRLNGQDEATWTAIPDDVFDGVGEQWDVYRAMRDTVQDDWAAYHPITNVMVSNSLLLFTSVIDQLLVAALYFRLHSPLKNTSETPREDRDETW